MRDSGGCTRRRAGGLSLLGLFGQFVDWVSGAWWSYPVVFFVSMLDAFFPLVPSETVVITAGVLASAGDMSLPLVIVCASLGAIVGDNVSYLLGRWLGERTVKRVFGGGRSRRAFEWAERQLQVRGFYLIVVARFVPGGRTAVTFSSGYAQAMRWRRFIVADVIAGSLWGSYAALLGYVGGKQFENAPWKGLLLAFAVAVGATGLVELVRRLRNRRLEARKLEAELGGD
jgi:membrane-associated protein